MYRKLIVSFPIYNKSLAAIATTWSPVLNLPWIFIHVEKMINIIFHVKEVSGVYFHMHVKQRKWKKNHTIFRVLPVTHLKIQIKHVKYISLYSFIFPPSLVVQVSVKSEFSLRQGFCFLSRDWKRTTRLNEQRILPFL